MGNGPASCLLLKTLELSWGFVLVTIWAPCWYGHQLLVGWEAISPSVVAKGIQAKKRSFHYGFPALRVSLSQSLSLSFFLCVYVCVYTHACKLPWKSSPGHLFFVYSLVFLIFLWCNNSVPVFSNIILFSVMREYCLKILKLILPVFKSLWTTSNSVRTEDRLSCSPAWPGPHSQSVTCLCLQVVVIDSAPPHS